MILALTVIRIPAWHLKDTVPAIVECFYPGFWGGQANYKCCAGPYTEH